MREVRARERAEGSQVTSAEADPSQILRSTTAANAAILENRLQQTWNVLGSHESTVDTKIKGMAEEKLKASNTKWNSMLYAICHWGERAALRADAKRAIARNMMAHLSLQEQEILTEAGQFRLGLNHLQANPGGLSKDELHRKQNLVKVLGKLEAKYEKELTKSGGRPKNLQDILLQEEQLRFQLEKLEISPAAVQTLLDANLTGNSGLLKKQIMGKLYAKDPKKAKAMWHAAKDIRWHGQRHRVLHATAEEANTGTVDQRLAEFGKHGRAITFQLRGEKVECFVHSRSSFPHVHLEQLNAKPGADKILLLDTKEGILSRKVGEEDVEDNLKDTKKNQFLIPSLYRATAAEAVAA